MAKNRYTVVGVLVAAIALSLSGATAAMAANSPNTQPPPPPNTVWSDCLYANPQPDNNALVDSYYNATLNIGVDLVCGNHNVGDINGFGVRHISDGHGFDDFTEDCINLVVQKTPYLTPGSGPRNQAFRFTQNGVTGVVVYNVDTKNIVTAYTQGSGGDGNWEGCVEALTPAAATVPDLHAPAGAHPTTALLSPTALPRRAAAAITPQSATGCTANFFDTDIVCIDVEGSGLLVDHVTPSEIYLLPGTSCATPYLYANGSLYAQGAQVCSPNELNTELQWTIPLNQYYADQTQLCVTWTDASSLEPCETVHS